MRRTLIISLSLLVSGISLAIILRDVPLSEITTIIGQARWPHMLISMACITGGLWVRGWRWLALLSAPIPASAGFFIIAITFMLNQLPLRAGEVARSLLATRYQVPLVTAATSIVVERLLDTVFVVVLLSLALAGVPSVPPEVGRAALLFGGVALGGFVVLACMVRWPGGPRRLLAGAEALVPPVRRLQGERWLAQALAGLAPLADSWRMVRAIALTMLAWGFSFAALLVLHPALDLTTIDIVSNTALGLTLTSFSVAIPVSVAALGPFEAAMVVAGRMTGLDAAAAIALGLLIHGLTVLCYLVWGMLGFVRLGLDMSTLRMIPRQEPA